MLTVCLPSSINNCAHCILLISVVDPNTLNLDPDPDKGFWPNLDPDPGPGLNYKFWRKIIIIF